VIVVSNTKFVRGTPALVAKVSIAEKMVPLDGRKKQRKE